MAFRPLPSQEVLRQLLDYDPETGALRYIGASTTAFHTFVDRDGYVQCKIGSEIFKAHRLIWRLVTGVEPHFVDHINGDRADNSWLNLRSVKKGDNARNRKAPSNNTSGDVGVSFRHDTGKWLAFIGFRGRKHRLGYFTEKTDAVAARKAAEREYGFHENHGRQS